jgi:glutathione S-transferase
VASLTLVIGNWNYSSWSLRPWIALRQSGLDFAVERIPLYAAGTKERILAHSGAGLVPVLHEGDTPIWESLAICERVAELAPGARLWPAHALTRAVARSVATEMHGGFPAVRATLPMNFRARAPRTPSLSEDARAQIRRIEEIWTSCRQRFGAMGPFLFGGFTIADAMYAPVVSRFRTYGVALGPLAQAYADAIWATPAMQEWGTQAAQETERMPETDALLGA